jgi:integrase
LVKNADQGDMQEVPPSPTENRKKTRKDKVKNLSIYKNVVNGKVYWRVTTPKVGGGRHILNFNSYADAKAAYDRALARIKESGLHAFEMSEEDRLDARQAYEILVDFGSVSLTSAAEFYAEHHRRLAESRNLREVIGELLKAKQADGASARYQKDLRIRLNKFAETFGEEPIAKIMPPQIGDWLRGLQVGPLTRNTFHLRLSALFAFAVDHGWASANPLEQVAKAKVFQTEPGILTPEQFGKLLELASPETRPYFAIGGLAGLRTAELERLDWEDIDLEERLIEVSPRKSKTAARRHVTIEPVLEAWLAPYRGRSGKLCPLNLRTKLEADRERAGIISWPSNALRHSFGSYHIAAFEDAAKTALQMGHVDAELTFAFYRQRTRKSVASRWWQLFPKTTPANVVQITAAS